MGRFFGRSHDKPRAGSGVRFRLGFLARLLYPLLRILVGPGGAPGASVFLADVLLYGFIVFVVVRFSLFSFFPHRLTSPPGLASPVLEVVSYRSSVAHQSYPAEVSPADSVVLPADDSGFSPICRVFCAAGVDCSALARLNPYCEVVSPP